MPHKSGKPGNKSDKPYEKPLVPPPDLITTPEEGAHVSHRSRILPDESDFRKEESEVIRLQRELAEEKAKRTEAEDKLNAYNDAPDKDIGDIQYAITHWKGVDYSKPWFVLEGVQVNENGVKVPAYRPVYSDVLRGMCEFVEGCFVSNNRALIFEIAKHVQHAVKIQHAPLCSTKSCKSREMLSEGNRYRCEICNEKMERPKKEDMK